MIDLSRQPEPYDTLDGFHPTLSGMKTIAEGVINELMEDTEANPPVKRSL